MALIEIHTVFKRVRLIRITIIIMGKVHIFTQVFIALVYEGLPWTNAHVADLNAVA